MLLAELLARCLFSKDVHAGQELSKSSRVSSCRVRRCLRPHGSGQVVSNQDGFKCYGSGRGTLTRPDPTRERKSDPREKIRPARIRAILFLAVFQMLFSRFQLSTPSGFQANHITKGKLVLYTHKHIYALLMRECAIEQGSFCEGEINFEIMISRRARGREKTDGLRPGLYGCKTSTILTLPSWVTLSAPPRPRLS